MLLELLPLFKLEVLPEVEPEEDELDELLLPDIEEPEEELMFCAFLFELF